MRFDYSSLFAFLFIFIHILLFTDYSVHLPSKPLLRILPGIFFLLDAGVKKKDIVVTLILLSICLINLDKINVIEIVFRMTHFLITLSIARYIASELRDSYTKSVLYPLFISITLSFISVFINLGVDNFEQRIGYVDLIQFSGIYSNPITLGWACFFYILFSRFNKEQGNIIIQLSIIIMGYYTYSRQFLLNFAIYASQIVIRKTPKLGVIMLITFLVSSPLWLLYLINNKLIFVGDLDLSILGSRFEVINLFVKLKDEIGILGIGYGNSEAFIFDQIGKDYTFHSSYLNILSEFGIFGWIILALFIPYAIVKDLKEKENPYLLIQFLLLAFLTSVFDYSSSFVAPFFYIIFFFILGKKKIERP